MTVEQQVTSLELSRRLQELGVKQKSLFWWEHVTEMATSTGVQNVDYFRITDGASRTGFISAFTVAELGEILPDEIMDAGAHTLTIRKVLRTWYVRYENDEDQSIKGFEKAATEADARSKMLIYLIENNLLK